MSVQPTIIAQASAPGHGGRAVIRAAGDDAFALLDAVCVTGVPRTRGSHAGQFRLGPTAFIPVQILLYASPHSYTGEDAFELLLPCNSILIDRVMQSLLAAGGQLATPGEFTARAYLAGRLTLEQAEGVAAIISAQNAGQLSAARRLLDGRQGLMYLAWADELLTLLALVEAGIDFTDQEDVVAIEPAVLDARLERVEGEIHRHLPQTARATSVGSLPSVALVGPPSAGKSTLLNALLGVDRAVTDEKPGTTRDVLRERLELSHEIPGSGPVELLDLPGLDADLAEGPSACAAQEAAHAAIRAADAILYCDPTGRFAPLDVVPAATPVVRVRTKADLPFTGSGEQSSVAVCALDRWNLPVLRRAIADVTTRSSAGQDALIVPRHQRALAQAAAAIAMCREVLQGPVDALRRSERPDPSLIADSLRRATDALGDLTGRVAPDDVLGRIFSTFCIGK
jgi:tRNA modification GTPase